MSTLPAPIESDRHLGQDAAAPAHASHAETTALTDATPKTHGPLSPSDADALRQPEASPASRSTIAARDGGAAGAHDLHREPLRTVAAGPGTNEASIVAASQPLRLQPAKAATDDPQIKDLGWSVDHEDVSPLFKNLGNEELWVLIRRFDKQVFGVRRIEGLPIGGLDMLPAEDIQYSPDRLRAELERLYMTCFTGGASFLKHLARLRSWNERPRTVGFMICYIVAWFFDMLLPTLFVLLFALTINKPLRARLFPPVPLAIVSAKHGKLQKPKAGVLGSADSLTGATETYKGQAVEAEASNFVSGISSVAVATAFGAGSGSDGASDAEHAKSGMDEGLPDPTAAVTAVSDARGTAEKSKPPGSEDKTKAAVHQSIWSRIGPIIRVIGDISDTQERFANALSPTKPFSSLPKYRVAATLLPLIFATAIVKAHWVAKGAGAGIGFAFFGGPLIERGIHYLNAKLPDDWPKYLELQTTILAGAPSNAQLAVALLRIGEANKSPLPPPPAAGVVATQPPPAQPSHAEISEVARDNPLADPEQVHAAAGAPPLAAEAEAEPMPQKKSSKLVGLLKGSARAGITTVLGVDRLKAPISEKSKQRLGVLPKEDARRRDGPSHFACRYHGKKGRAWITTTAITPSVSYSRGVDGGEETTPQWTIQLNDIQELRKVGGLGFKSKLIVGAVLHAEMADGIELVDVEGHIYRLTAIQRRDELFNRLASLGPQVWATT